MSSGKSKKMTNYIKINDFRKNFYRIGFWNRKGLVYGINQIPSEYISTSILAVLVMLSVQKTPIFTFDSKAIYKPKLLMAYCSLIGNSRFSIGIISSYNIDKLNIWVQK